jgi:hypothetical protein
MLPFASFLRRKQPLFFLKMKNRVPRMATPPTGAAMAMAVVITLDWFAVFWMPPSLLSACWRLAADACGATLPAEGVLLSVDEMRVVGSAVAGLSTAGGVDKMGLGDDEGWVGSAAGGSEAVPVEEIRDATDSSRGVDAGAVGVCSTGVVGVFTAAAADVAGIDDKGSGWSAPGTPLLVGAAEVLATSDVGVVEVGKGDGDAEEEEEEDDEDEDEDEDDDEDEDVDVDSAPAALPLAWAP